MQSKKINSKRGSKPKATSRRSSKPKATSKRSSKPNVTSKSSSATSLENVANPQINNIIVLDSPHSTVILTLLTALFSLLSQQSNNKLDIECLNETLTKAMKEDREQREAMLKDLEKIIVKNNKDL